MSKTVAYYNCYITKNGKKTHLWLDDLLDKLIVIKKPYRLRKINSFPMILHDMEVPKGGSKNRTISIGKFRENFKPYVGTYSDLDNLELIKQEVIEMVTIFFSPTNRLAIVENNTYGSKIGDIESYFNSFFSMISPEKWNVEFIPIDAVRNFNDVKKSEQIRFIEITLNMSKGLKSKVLKEQEEEETFSSFLGLFSSSKEVVNDIDAKKVKLSFSIGNGKNNTMKVDTAIELLELLDLQNDIIESVKVKFRDKKTGGLETINLKHYGQLKDQILKNDKVKNPSWQKIGEAIKEELFEKKHSYANYTFKELQGNGLLSTKLPQISRECSEEYKVDIVNAKGSNESEEQSSSPNEIKTVAT